MEGLWYCKRDIMIPVTPLICHPVEYITDIDHKFKDKHSICSCAHYPTKGSLCIIHTDAQVTYEEQPCMSKVHIFLITSTVGNTLFSLTSTH